MCKDGTLSDTTEPETFCTSLVEAEGATLEPGDGLVLEILGTSRARRPSSRWSSPTGTELQWGTQPVGPTVEATFVSR